MREALRFVVLFCLLAALAGACPACSDPACGGGERPPGWPKRSDVLLTSRAPHFTPAGTPPKGVGRGVGLYDTWQAAAAFHATRLDWVYTLNGSFVRALPAHNLTGISLAMNPQVEDAAGTFTTGRVLNAYGEPLVAPWMRTWAPPHHYYGCVNNPAYKQLAIARARQLVALGATMIQHDDPESNAEATQWDRGDPRTSGCYCPVCVKGFTAALLDGALNGTELRRLNVTAAFDYGAYVRGEYQLPAAAGAGAGARAPLPWDPEKNATLRAAFVQFQRNATRAYARELRAAVPAAVPLSGNNGGFWGGDATAEWDGGLGELRAGDANPGGLREIFVDAVPAGKAQLMTMPKESNATAVASAAGTRRTRRALAQAFALGGGMLAPWDIYLPTPDARRYYGSAADYADLFAFARAQRRLLDALPALPYYRDGVAAAGMREAHRANVRAGGGGTGGNDGARWRLPTDAPPAPGRQLSPRSRAACAFACAADAQCAGCFSRADGSGAGRGGACFTLPAPLVLVNGTALAGYSYAREAGGARAGGGVRLEVVALNVSAVDVDVVLRAPAGVDRMYTRMLEVAAPAGATAAAAVRAPTSRSIRASNASAAAREWAVHLVDWTPSPPARATAAHVAMHNVAAMHMHSAMHSAVGAGPIGPIGAVLGTAYLCPGACPGARCLLAAALLAPGLPTAGVPLLSETVACSAADPNATAKAIPEAGDTSWLLQARASAAGVEHVNAGNLAELMYLMA
eukprot:g1369.t1